jgi:hypothetical protein
VHRLIVKGRRAQQHTHDRQRMNRAVGPEEQDAQILMDIVSRAKGPEQEAQILMDDVSRAQSPEQSSSNFW